MFLKEIKKEVDGIKSAPEDLRKFGFTLGIFFALVGLFFLWKKNEAITFLWVLSGFFLSFGAFFPRVLKPIQKAWMTLALLMGWVMTKVILGIVFFLMMTPIGLILRLARKDLLNLKYPDSAGSYWLTHAAKDKAAYENQF